MVGLESYLSGLAWVVASTSETKVWVGRGKWREERSGVREREERPRSGGRELEKEKESVPMRRRGYTL